MSKAQKVSSWSCVNLIIPSFLFRRSPEVFYKTEGEKLQIKTCHFIALFYHKNQDILVDKGI